MVDPAKYSVPPESSLATTINEGKLSPDIAVAIAFIVVCCVSVVTLRTTES